MSSDLIRAFASCGSGKHSDNVAVIVVVTDVFFDSTENGLQIRRRRHHCRCRAVIVRDAIAGGAWCCRCCRRPRRRRRHAVDVAVGPAVAVAVVVPSASAPQSESPFRRPHRRHRRQRLRAVGVAVPSSYRRLCRAVAVPWASLCRCCCPRCSQSVHRSSCCVSE